VQRTVAFVLDSWHNQLNPEINKNVWSDREEKAMFEAHQQHGNKWTEIAKCFPGRTDNDIKNHFYSMLRRSLRRVNKLLGMRNSTQRIKLIKPSVLSSFFSNNNANPLECKRNSPLTQKYLLLSLSSPKPSLSKARVLRRERGRDSKNSFSKLQIISNIVPMQRGV